MTEHRQCENSNRVLVAVLVDSAVGGGATASGFVAGDPAPGQRGGPPASVGACRSSSCHDVVTRQSRDARILILQSDARSATSYVMSSRARLEEPMTWPPGRPYVVTATTGNLPNVTFSRWPAKEGRARWPRRHAYCACRRPRYFAHSTSVELYFSTDRRAYVTSRCL
jgi:hypothetical protein